MAKKRVIGLAYVIVTFFLLPFVLISIHKEMTGKDELEKHEIVQNNNIR
jgi:hypothetical protein